MKQSSLYRINIFGLRLGSHHFQFAFDQSIFEKYKDRIIESGEGQCHVTLHKSDMLISLEFEIKGRIDLMCDRSLEFFQYPVEIEERLMLKYGEVFDDHRDDIWIISHRQESIDIEKNIYEYLTLAVPMKKLHPRYSDTATGEVELELVYSSSKPPEEEMTDARWHALKSLNIK